MIWKAGTVKLSTIFRGGFDNIRRNYLLSTFFLRIYQNTLNWYTFPQRFSPIGGYQRLLMSPVND